MKGYAVCYNDKALAFSGKMPFTLEAYVYPEDTVASTPIITKGNDEWKCTESYGLHPVSVAGRKSLYFSLD